MTKLIVLVLVFTALVALASAHKTITITTTTTITEDTRENTLARKCGERVRGRNFNFCHSFIARALPPSGSPVPGQKERLQELQKQCCNQVRELTQECQCDAMKEVYSQQKQLGGQPMEEVRKIIQKLPKICRLQIKQCQIPSAMF